MSDCIKGSPGWLFWGSFPAFTIHEPIVVEVSCYLLYNGGGCSPSGASTLSRNHSSKLVPMDGKCGVQ